MIAKGESPTPSASKACRVCHDPFRIVFEDFGAELIRHRALACSGVLSQRLCILLLKPSPTFLFSSKNLRRDSVSVKENDALAFFIVFTPQAAYVSPVPDGQVFNLNRVLRQIFPLTIPFFHRAVTRFLLLQEISYLYPSLKLNGC